MFEILIDISLDTGHKGDGFSKSLVEKSVKFVQNRKDGIVTFN